MGIAQGFVAAYLLTIAIETLVLYILLRSRYPTKISHPNKTTYPTRIIVRNSIIASSVTLPFVWFLFPGLCSILGFDYAIQIAISELFAFGVEAWAYRIIFVKMSWKDAILVSFAANLLSFSAGLIFL